MSTGHGFTEGPTWDPTTRSVWFSDIPGDAVRAFHLDDGTTTDWIASSGNSNGLLRLENGDLLSCEHGGRRVVVHPAGGGPPVIVAEQFEGARLNSPNDVARAADGTLYFTDPPYGVNAADRELSFQGVFRVTPAGALTLEFDAMTAPNGVALSLDEETLWVADSADGLVQSFSVNADGSLGAPTLFLDDTPSADGIVRDDAGNLYIATADGVRVVRDDGSPIGLVELDEVPANVAFGGDLRRTLFITARTSLYAVDLLIPGGP